MSGRDILFNLPQAGWLLLFLIPLLYAQIALRQHRKNQQQKYASSSLLSRLLIPRSSHMTHTKTVGWLFIWILICLALMQPFGNFRYSSLEAHSPSKSAVKSQIIPHEVIFLVDTSASMGVPDGPDGETRLEEAKVIIEDVIRQLHGETISLYAFTSELSALVPPTVDYLFTRLSIKELHIDEGDVGGTRYLPILTSLQQEAFPEPSHKRYTIIMLSDGGDTRLEQLKGAAREQEIDAILNVIKNPEQLHLRLFTVGIGSLKPQPIPNVSFEGKEVLSKLEPNILKQLAEKERGQYYMAQEWTSWDLAQELVLRINESEAIDKAEQSERKVAEIQQEDILVDLYYQVPLGLALLLYCLNLMLPDVRR